MNTKWKTERYYRYLFSSYSMLLVALANLLLIVGCGGSPNDPSIDVPISTSPPPEVFDDIEIFTIDIKTAIYSGNILHNGSADNSQSSDGELFIKGMDSLEEPTPLGSLSERDFELRLIQGDYQVEYSHQYGDEIPKNKSAVVKDEFLLTENLTEDINIESINIGSNVLLNGMPFPSDPTTEAIYFLKPVNGGKEVLLGTSFINGESVRIISGDYQVVYTYIRGDNIPLNVDFTLPEIYSINTDTTLEINIHAVDVRVRFFTEGIKTDFNSDNIAHFLLKSSGAENMTDLGSTEQELISVPLIVGDYDLIYDYQTGDQIPINTNKKISEITIEDGTVIEPIIDKVTLEGSFYHNGEVPSESGLDYAELFLQDEGSDELYSIGRTNHFSYENLNIIASTYDIIYEYREGGALPRNSLTPMIEMVSLTESGNYDIEIKSIVIEFSVTLNGQAFPESGISYADIYLDGNGDNQILLGATHSAMEQVRLLPRNYRLHYDGREFTNVPRHENFIAEPTFALSESGSYSHDFQANTIRVDTLIDGRDDVSGALAYGNLYFEREGGNRLYLGKSYDPIEVMVMTGVYDLYYEFREGAEFIPRNKYTKIQSIDVNN